MSRIYSVENGYQSPQGSHLVWDLSPQEVKAAFDSKAIEQWYDEQQGDGADAELYRLLLEKLSPVFEFISMTHEPRLVAARCWVLLYMVRPDLIDYETADSAAVRFDMRANKLREQVQNFRAAFPSVRWPKRQRDDIKKSSARVRRKTLLLRDGGKVHPSFEAYEKDRNVA